MKGEMIYSFLYENVSRNKTLAGHNILDGGSTFLETLSWAEGGMDSFLCFSVLLNSWPEKSKSSMSRYQRRLVTALDYLSLFRDYCTTVHMYSVFCTRAMVWCGRVRWGMNSLLVHIRGSWVHQSIQATSHLSASTPPLWENCERI